ncbi:hypothetical protein F3Y22_tig00004630pilonHSYRG00115 [Hibiscus syriacus]|uniref:Uncharacterized protein n=1 Tax=Hibiscus syriacus TaxID=106335 RepID=A0A6A3CG55_HIBSY|nr:hypothetical protein F3Y22_tig00004630pilonHSYRG00115 [Hibiscus syriacus]
MDEFDSKCSVTVLKCSGSFDLASARFEKALQRDLSSLQPVYFPQQYGNTPTRMSMFRSLQQNQQQQWFVYRPFYAAVARGRQMKAVPETSLASTETSPYRSVIPCQRGTSPVRSSAVPVSSRARDVSGFPSD